MSFDFRNHSILITGGTQGVGAEIAFAFAKAGASVLIHGLKNDDQAQEVLLKCQPYCDQSGGRCSLLVADFMQPPESYVDDFFARTIATLPSIDLLVNNAGAYIDRPFLEMDYRTYERTLQLNVTAGYFLTQKFARHWIDKKVRGRVVFTGSINGLLAEPVHSAYDLSKAAVAGMVRSLCVSLAPVGIRVNSMAPGLVRTPLTDRVLSSDPETLAWMKLHTPCGEVPTSAACAGTVLFLMSDLAEHIHGQTVYVDGGMSIWQQPDLPASLRGPVRTMIDSAASESSP